MAVLVVWVFGIAGIFDGMSLVDVCMGVVLFVGPDGTKVPVMAVVGFISRDSPFGGIEELVLVGDAACCSFEPVRPVSIGDVVGCFPEISPLLGIAELVPEVGIASLPVNPPLSEVSELGPVVDVVPVLGSGVSPVPAPGVAGCSVDVDVELAPFSVVGYAVDHASVARDPVPTPTPGPV